MRLWTFQNPEFTLTAAGFDLNESSNIRLFPKLRPLYQELAYHCGLERYEIIWCWTRQDWNPMGYQSEVLWALEVPEEEFLRVLDEYTWAKIRNDRGRVPPSLLAKWESEAPQDTISDHIDEKIKEYDEQSPPADGWWSRLFIADVNAEGASVLLRHPIPESWIVSHKLPPH